MYSVEYLLWLRGNEDFMDYLFPDSMSGLGIGWDEEYLYDAYLDGYYGYPYYY